jgi:FlaG/FlaF family flagellin (archaellin)
VGTEMKYVIFDNDSGVSPIIGIILITAITVASFAIAYSAVNTFGLTEPVIANLDINSIDVSNHQEVVLLHRGGDSFDVSEISIFITVNNEMLDNNLIDLPVAGGTTGFYGTLGGVLWGSPQNQSHDNIWDPGDYGTFYIANSNAVLEPGDQVKVTIVYRVNDMIISSPTYHI